MQSRWLLISGVLAAIATLAISAGNFSTHNAAANPLGGLVAIAAGEAHTCAITDTGGVKCWGSNFEGRLGNGTAQASTVPQDTLSLDGAATAIAAGVDHTCAILDGGSVTCWGSAALPPGASSPGVPVAISDVSGSALALAGGQVHTCALIQTGNIQCWGKDTFGQLGSGPCSVYCSRAIVDVPGISGAIAVAAGTSHSCAALSAGSVHCWGDNRAGQVGDGTGTSRNHPVQVLGITNAVQVTAGAHHTCALTTSSSVKCWGQGYGNAAVDVSGLAEGVSAISAAQSHTCALMTTGAVKCWGDNGFGQLGDSQRCGHVCANPVDVIGLREGAAQIGVGLYHSCAVLTDGTAQCWGLNAGGQLGNGLIGFLLYSPQPVNVVADDVKPVPTPTTCALGGCPTATPRPAPPQTGLDFSLSIDSDANGLADCGTRTGEKSACDMASGTQFKASVNVLALSPGLTNYGGFDASIAFAGVASEHKSDVLWPDCGFPATYYDREFLAFGCVLPVGVATSSYVGPIGQTLFICAASGSITLEHGSGNTAILRNDGISINEAPSGGEQLTINCGEALAGDVDCTTLVNSVDAALMLQNSADLVDWLNCPQFADVNLDQTEDSIDSLLTLQYTAGLIQSLPVLPPP